MTRGQAGGENAGERSRQRHAPFHQRELIAATCLEHFILRLPARQPPWAQAGNNRRGVASPRGRHPPSGDYRGQRSAVALRTNSFRVRARPCKGPRTGSVVVIDVRRATLASSFRISGVGASERVAPETQPRSGRTQPATHHRDASLAPTVSGREPAIS
jgi:hypothetical protein